MLKALAAAASIVLALSFGVAYAQEMDCTDDAMTKMQTQVDAMTGEGQTEQKEMAMTELNKAKEMMKANNMADCKTHMANAMNAMMGQ